MESRSPLTNSRTTNPTALRNHALSIRRREIIQLGCSSLLGLGWHHLLGGQSMAAPAASHISTSIRSVVLVFLPGGPSHLDTFDPKPEAPIEIRGPFGTIATSVPEIQFSEHLPLLAARMKRLAILRSMAHEIPHHDAVCFIPCGIDALPPGFTGSASRGDWPCYAAGLNSVRPRPDGIPSGVCLPLALKNGPIPTPGMNAGFLGPKHDPLQVNHDPNAADFRVDGLSLRSDVLREQFDARRSLLKQIEAQSPRSHQAGSNDQYSQYRGQALDLLAAGKIADAFAIATENSSIRDRYGRHIYGQSLLLARRLVEAGVPMIQVNLGHPTEWDTHYDNFGPMKRKLLPRLDQGLSAFLDELHERGLLNETLVVVAGEFGRTPKIGDFQDGKFWPDGRGHWSSCFSILVAGGGVQGGRVIGASDSTGGYPVTTAYRPSDLGATIYTSLGIDPASMTHDPTGRPFRLNEGTRIDALFDSSIES